MKKKTKDIFKSQGMVIGLSVLAGVLLVLAIRLITYSPDHTHYHANFAVYINGAQEKFEGPRYYQEVTACSAEHSNNPKSRTHMHDNVNNVIHVHDDAVTWGQFFENIGWTLSSTSIIDASGKVYTENELSKLHLILNGQDYTGLGGLANKLIESKDKLLISYGGSDSTSLAQYNLIPGTADKYNHAQDPKSCGSDHETSLSERLKHLF